jgi:hypothetical protein
MPIVSFSADYHLASRLDQNGPSILIPVRCSTDDKWIDVGFYARVRYSVGPNGFISESASDPDVAKLLWPALFNQLSKCHRLNVYRIAEFDLRDFNPNAPPSETDPSVTLDATESLFAELMETTSIHKNSESAFDLAKEWLKDNVHHLHFNATGAHSAAHYLADCLTRSSDPNMRGWNMEKASLIKLITQNLVSRKNPNHPNYELKAKQLTDLLFVLHFPSFWSSRPPAPGSLREG